MQRTASDAELAAISRIQRWYRRMRRRRSEYGDLILLQIYVNCASNLPHVSEPTLENHSLFRKVARGPYPHALAMLERLMLLLGILKGNLKQRLRKAEHLELDHLQDGLTRTK